MNPHGDPLAEPATYEVADGVFAFIQPDGGWWINNAGFVVGGQDVVIVDSCATEGRTRRLVREIEARTTDRARRTLVNTHHHGDHTHGNYLLGAASIIASTPCRDLVDVTAQERYATLFEQPDWGDLRLAAPTLTVDTNLTLWPGGRRVEVHACPVSAHTTGDVVVWLPDERVLFTGDLVFHGGTPFIAFGSLEGSLESLQWLRSFDARVLVPGHGPLCDDGGLTRIEAYLGFLRDLAAEAVRAGRTPLEAAQDADLGRFADLGEPERIVGNLHRAMAETRGTEPDLGQVLADTATFVGGRIPCRA